MLNLTLGVTQNCNLNCKYCEQKHSDLVMPIATAIKGIDLLASSCVGKKIQISFYGGEPLLAENIIRESVLYADSMLQQKQGIKVVYEMTTNGLLLTEDFLKFTSNYNFLIALSHDGVSHNITRCNTLNRADEALDLLLHYYPKTPIMMTIHPDTAEYLSKSCEYFYSKGLKKVIFTPANGSKSIWCDDKLNILKHELQLVADFYINHNQGTESFCIAPLENKIKNYVNDTTNINSHCALDCNKILIDSDGSFYPCTHFIGRDEFACGNINTGWNLNKLASFEAERIKPNECSECALKNRCSHACACANHGFNASLGVPSDFQCEYERTLIELADKAAVKLINETNPEFVKRIYR